MIKFIHVRTAMLVLACDFISSRSKNSMDDLFGNSRYFMKHVKFNHLSGAKSETSCPVPNTYIIGAKIRTSDLLNQTFPSITALQITCSDRIGNKAHPKNVIIIDKNVGEWSEYRECPMGKFATGFTLHLQSVESYSLIAEDEIDSPSRVFNVIELGRSRYVSGITFNCSMSSDRDEYLLPYEKQNAVTLGWNSGFGLRIYCLDHQVIRGVTIVEEAVISYYEGERMIPIQLTVDCVPLHFPGGDCSTELVWENLESSNCSKVTGEKLYLEYIYSNLVSTNESEESVPRNVSVSCEVKHLVGSSVNWEIENILSIAESYKSTNFTDKYAFMLNKILEPKFRNDWMMKYKLTAQEYNGVIKNGNFVKLFYMQKKTTVLTFNVSSNWFILSKVLESVAKSEELKHEVQLLQLVGYCGFFKVLFPYFKMKYSTFFMKNLNKKLTKIVLLENEMRVYPSLTKTH